MYLNLHRAIKVTDLRVGHDGAAPQDESGDFLQAATSSDVNALSTKLDAWLFPFLNVYMIVGGVWNESVTNFEATLPPIRPGGDPLTGEFSVPTSLNGPVGGFGFTLAAGTRSLFDQRRPERGSRQPRLLGGPQGGHRIRASGVARQDQRTFRTGVGCVDLLGHGDHGQGIDPRSRGGTLNFEVDQGPLYPNTAGIGFAYGVSGGFQLAVDLGTDFHRGWYVAFLPTFRFGPSR